MQKVWWSHKHSIAGADLSNIPESTLTKLITKISYSSAAYVKYHHGPRLTCAVQNWNVPFRNMGSTWCCIHFLSKFLFISFYRGCNRASGQPKICLKEIANRYALSRGGGKGKSTWSSFGITCQAGTKGIKRELFKKVGSEILPWISLLFFLH